MSRLRKIESFEDLLNERARLKNLKEQNELLIKQEIEGFKELFKPVFEITSIFSKADNEEEKREKKSIIKKYVKITLPYLAAFTGRKILALKIISLINKLFSKSRHS